MAAARSGDPVTWRRGGYWPWLLGAGMLGIVGVNVVMLFVAASDANGAVVEADYYRKAVAWDVALARRAASETLGWRDQVMLRHAGRGAEVVLHLAAATGTPIGGATVEATLIHNLDAAHPRTLPLREVAPGRYAGAALLSHDGQWEVRVIATRAADRYEVTRHVDLAAVPAR
jgi:nitrogen fixation protein FixH